MFGAGMAAARQAAANDPMFADVFVLLGNDNAADGTLTYLDQSPLAATWSKEAGTVVYSNATAPTGMTTSLSFSASGWLSSPDRADWDLGSGDLTLEAMMRTGVAGGGAILGQNANVTGYDPATLAYGTTFGTTQRLQSWVSSSGAAWAFGPGNAGSNNALNSWEHVALTRNGSAWNMWRGGVSVWSNTLAAALFASAGKMVVGNFQGQFFTGNLCCIRGTKACRYTGPFTPPPLPFPTS